MGIKDERIKAGFTRADIFRLIGIPIRTLENWENGLRKASEWEEKLIIEKIRALAEEKEQGKMKRFEIRKESVEINYKNRFDIKEGITLQDVDCVHNPELIEIFDTLEEAREALKKYKTSIRTFKATLGTIFLVTEYYIEENVYDEDGEWIEGGDVFDFTPMIIKVVRESDSTEIARFGNMADAEKFINNYDEENENAVVDLF